jgi:hypothetical protein
MATDPSNGGANGGNGANGQAGGGGGGPPISPIPVPSPAELFKRFASIRFAVEFANKQNGNCVDPITKKTLRGRWSNANLRGRTADNAMASMPDIPGIMVVFDGSKRIAEYRDPLAEEGAADLLKTVQTICKECRLLVPTPDKKRSFPELTLDRMKQYCYWARRWIDSEMVVVSAGNVPTMAEIGELPGRVELELFNVNAARQRFIGADPQTGAPKLYETEIPPYMTPKEAAGTLV